ncbi:hypothetical protein IF650_15280 [Cellulosimicrobium terreum]|nr:hypothetical protein [Cellulosimicrobium terreum]
MNLPQPVAVGIWVVLGVALLVLVLVGRRRLSRRSVGVVPAPPAVPADEARGPVVLGPLDALYVTSTLAGDWLARVGAHGLGDRSRATVTVHDGGVHVARTGAPDLWVPADVVDGAGLTPGMAGKFVGKDAIVVVSWSVPVEPLPADPDAAGAPPAGPDPVRLDTGLMPRRRDDVARLLDAVGELADRRTGAPPSAAGAPTEPPTELPTDRPTDKEDS